ncbi:MAG: ABC transporter permease [Thermoanaerobaculia bacterium]|nr:ABC transporter permease [Thermoanaerobaculia bacterium]
MTQLKIILTLLTSSAQIQKKRAYLTIAAIAWGTVAILLLLGFGEGLKRQLDKNRRAMGENIAVIWGGETTKAWKGMNPGRQIRMRIEDVEYIRKRMPELKAVIGEIQNWRTALNHEGKTVNARVTGANHVYGEARKHYPVAGGRFFTEVDENQRRRVIFLGDELRTDLFGEIDPVGETLLVNNVPYTVIGVMQEKTQMGAYSGPDSQHATIPLATFRSQFGRDRLHNMVIQVEEPEQMEAALVRFRELLGAKYGFDPEDEPALQIWDTVETSKITQNITIGIQLFLGIIGGLTLLIGGVGVANIMYAVVKERTREIGVKMALGAKGRWIVVPFVLEGLMYTLVGGALGIVIGMLLVTAMSFIPADSDVMKFLGTPTISVQIGVLTAAILGLIGVVAGYFPARRAAAVDPAATLRYE